MEVEYLREMRQNYLMIQAEESQEQGYEARMMIGNTIDGLLKFRIKKSDNRCRFCYEITSKQPLSRMLEKKAINAVQIRGLLLGIARTLTRMEDYLLSEEQILLDPDYIYVDPEEYEPFLCLLPGKRGDFPEEFSLFLQYLLGNTDHEDKEAVVLIYGLYRESLKENYGLDNLLRWVMKENYPDMEYRNKGENCERMKPENTESWDKKGIAPETAGIAPGQTDASEKVQKYAGSPERISYLYLLPGSVMILLAAGIRFFSGRYGLIPYAVFLGAAGIALLLLGGSLGWFKWFAARKRDRTEDSRKVSYGLSSCSRSSCERALTHTSSNTDRQTSFRETSNEASGLNPLFSNQNPQPNVSSRPGQWQMIFDEPEEEQTEEPSTSAVSQAEEMRTVLLWNQSEEKPVRSLVSRDGEGDIVLSYYPFIIGKQEGLCDYVLDKSTVSRLHVRIDETEEGYRVTDLNSTNGTFVNGRPLDANGTALIQPGDEIGVADLRFQLK